MVDYVWGGYELIHAFCFMQNLSCFLSAGMFFMRMILLDAGQFIFF